MLKTLLRDRRLWLLVLVAALTLTLGRFALPDSWALTAVVKSGYWWMFVLGTVFVYSNWRAFRASRTASSPCEFPLGAAAAVLAIGILWQAHETHGFKVLADEALLLGTSQSMHLDRDVGYPVRTTDIFSHFQILQAVLDKRPIFFPFVVSLVHDLTGYRATNSFWLNTGLSFGFLALVFVLGKELTNAKAGGALALLVAAGSPLLAQQAAGGGFELLNLSLMALFWIWCIRHLREPRPEMQDALVLTAIALASTRYESALVLLPAALVIIVGWWRGGRLLCTPLTWVAPLLLLPTFWLNQAFSANSGYWEMQTMGATRPFGLEFVKGNLGHALAFFFSTDGYQPNSLIWSVLGFLALPLAALWAFQTLRRPSASTCGEDLGILLGALAPLLVSALMMVYFWGQFDHPVIRRLSLPTHLLLLGALGVAAGRVLPQWRWKWNILAGVATLGLVAWSLPVMAKNAYGREYSPALAHLWRSELIGSVIPRGALMIDRDTFIWSANLFAATPIAQAKLRREGIGYHLRNNSFSGTYVVQAFTAEPETGELKIEAEDDLGPDFELEPVCQKRLQILHFMRLSRVKAIRDDRGEWNRAVDAVPSRSAPQRFGETEREAAKQAYMEKWIKQLP